MARYVFKPLLCVVAVSFLPIFAQEQAIQNVQAQIPDPAQSNSSQSAVEQRVSDKIESPSGVKIDAAEQVTTAKDQPSTMPAATMSAVEQKSTEGQQEEPQEVSSAQGNEATETAVEVQKEPAVAEQGQPEAMIEKAGEITQPQQAPTKELEQVAVTSQQQAETTTQAPQENRPEVQPEAAKEESVQPSKADDIQEAKPEEPAEPEGLDTLDIQGGGNWLLKRGWWEQAERKYEKAKVLLDKILDARTPFLDKRSEMDRTVFDPFYAQMGLDQGRLEETLSFLNDEVDQERDKEGTLTEEQRAFLDTLTMQKKTLEQLALDVSAINKLDHQVDAVIAKLMEQINRARGYEKQAWQSFKEIARELSDERARELAGAMDSHFANMEAIYTYIVTDLAQFYAKLVEDGTKQVEQVKAEMQALKEKGIDIKGQSERLRQQEMSPESTQSEEEKQEEAKKAFEKAKAEQQGFFGKMFSYVTGFFSAIGRFFSTIFSSIFGRK